MKSEKKKKVASGMLAIALALVGLTACGAGYTPKKLSRGVGNLTGALKEGGKREGDGAAFTEKNLGFATEFFRRSFSKANNVLVSPLSLAVALAMTANGAEGETLSQMEGVLGLPVEELNTSLSSYVAYLDGLNGEKTKLSVADSIWLRDTYVPYVQKQFLQTNKDYYNAEIFSAPFDQTTVDDINKWTENKTEGMIKKILDDISSDSFMYLINALYFEGEWTVPYTKSSVKEGDFTNVNGDVSRVKMMYSSENVYVEDENTTGFIKPYKGQKLALAAFLPDENISVDEYAAGMSAAKWKALLESKKTCEVRASLPAFSYDFSVMANGILSEMGMPDAFTENADFSRLMPEAYIANVAQKTRIEVSETGTKAAAVTEVEGATGALREYKVVTLDRPFVYAIIDTENDYPLFLGAVNTFAA